MRSIRSVVLCSLALCATPVFAQSSTLEPLHAATGSVLTFYLQTRMNSTTVNALNELPRGTVLRVHLLDSIDSGVDRDGTAFRGALVSPVVSANNEIIVHADAEVKGLFVLLRSRNHPEGFRYELLLTSVTENGKPFGLTASWDASFSDVQKPATTANATASDDAPKAETPISTKAVDPLHNH
jgi:hypothetical protein